MQHQSIAEDVSDKNVVSSAFWVEVGPIVQQFNLFSD